MDFKKNKISIDGLQIVYYTIGKGPSILFLHGGRTRALTYKKNLVLLSQKYFVIAPDIPLFGDSDIPKEEWSFTNFAHLFDKFLKKLKLKNVIVIGYSFGGGIAFNLAAMNKDVSKLILVNTADQASPRESELSKLIHRILFYSIRPQYYSVFYKLANDYLIYSIKHFFDLSHINKVRKHALSTKYKNLRKIGIPTLILWSKNDTIFPLDIAERFKNRIGKSKLEIVDGNHEWILLNPELFYKKVIEFCA